MASQSYYGDGADQSQYGNQQYNYQQGQNQAYPYNAPPATDMNQTQDRGNPFGYPEAGAPQPYYGHSQGPPPPAQHPVYDQHQYNNYGYQDQQQAQYNAPSYGYGAQPAAPFYSAGSGQPLGYDTSYAPVQGHDEYSRPPPTQQQQYTGPYGGAREQGQGQYQYAQPTPQGYNQYPPSNAVSTPLAVPANEINPNAPPAAEGERGLLGALAGGAMGAYGGHQMGHGVIGALGGAYAGHKLEDNFKDKKKEKKHRKHHSTSLAGGGNGRRRRGSNSSSSSSSSSSSDSDSGKDKKHRKHKDKYAVGAAGGLAAGSAYAASASSHSRDRSRSASGRYKGNFSTSCSNITLDRDYDLIALCADSRGHEKLSSIKLNDYLVNEWGSLKWAKGGNAFATAISGSVRLRDGGRVLEAEMNDGRGGSRRSQVRLDERIGNEDGELVFVG